MTKQKLFLFYFVIFFCIFIPKKIFADSHNYEEIIKIIQQDYDTFQDRNEYRDGSVHAFVDRNTGEVYKPASWKSPAKHVRYDMRIIRERANLHDPNFVDWAGGYLYMR